MIRFYLANSAKLLTILLFCSTSCLADGFHPLPDDKDLDLAHCQYRLVVNDVSAALSTDGSIGYETAPSHYLSTVHGEGTAGRVVNGGLGRSFDDRLVFTFPPSLAGHLSKRLSAFKDIEYAVNFDTLAPGDVAVHVLFYKNPFAENSPTTRTFFLSYSVTTSSGYVDNRFPQITSYFGGPGPSEILSIEENCGVGAEMEEMASSILEQVEDISSQNAATDASILEKQELLTNLLCSRRPTTQREHLYWSKLCRSTRSTRR